MDSNSSFTISLFVYLSYLTGLFKFFRNLSEIAVQINNLDVQFSQNQE